MDNTFGGKIKLSDPISYKILYKVPSPVLEIHLTAGVDFGRNPQNQQNQVIQYAIEEASASLMLGPFPISHTFRPLPRIDPNNVAEISFTFKLSTQDLIMIESQRKDDLTLGLQVWGQYHPYVPSHTDLAAQPTSDFSLNVSWKLSQKEWLQILSDIGYAQKWVIEINRPELEGFNEVIKHLEKAEEALYNKNEPEDVIGDLRAARDSFKVFFDAKKQKITEIIDKGSTGEPNQEPKSERVYHIYEKISYFLNIGPHNDKYEVTYADAQFAFREFVTMLSYFSGILSQVKED